MRWCGISKESDRVLLWKEVAGTQEVGSPRAVSLSGLAATYILWASDPAHDRGICCPLPMIHLLPFRRASVALAELSREDKRTPAELALLPSGFHPRKALRILHVVHDYRCKYLSEVPGRFPELA